MTAPEQMRAEDGGPLVDRLRGRASFLHAVGQTKSASLMDEAAEALTRPATDELVEALERARPHVACTADCGTNAPGKMFPGECSCGAKDARDLIDTALRNAGAAS